MRHVTLITTGGTIEKTYDESTGGLVNRRSIVRRMLARLRLEETQVSVIELISKDSLHLTDQDRDRIVEAVRAAGACTEPIGLGEGGGGGGVVILHGTDTLSVTGERLLKDLGTIRRPVVLTAAMRPFEMTRSDALQNLTEAIFATGVLGPGVYAAAHGRVLAFPGVVKDRERGTFVKEAVRT
ncbi:MAG: asparaginase [Phycisphaeraceae bacterium]|nr:asparaginase [Phycisphaeraceae bacterium]